MNTTILSKVNTKYSTIYYYPNKTFIIHSGINISRLINYKLFAIWLCKYDKY